MKKRNKPLKIVASPFVLAGVIVMLLFLGVILFLVFLPVDDDVSIFSQIGCIICCVVFPIIALIDLSFRGFLSVLVIDCNGIKNNLFGIFPVKKTSWEEMYEIRYYERLRPFLLFSKCSLENLTYNQIITVIKRKDAVQVELTKKVYQAVISFTEKPIVDLTEEKIELLKLDK